MSISKQQKALLIHYEGGPLVLQDVDVGSPDPEDVLVKVEAAGLAPLDWKIQTHGILSPAWPQILGWDGAGVVVAVGSAVTNLKVGDRVALQGPFDPLRRTLQQYVVTLADIAIKIPDSLSFDDAVTLPVSIGTVAAPLYNKHEKAQSAKLIAPWEDGGRTLYAGKPAVVLGGASIVGQGALQFLRLSGFSPIITTASLRNSELVKFFGATHVIDRTLTRAALVSEIQRIAEGPIGLVYDAISLPDTKEIGYDVLAAGGSLIIVVPESISGHKLPVSAEKHVVTTMGLLAIPENREFGAKLAREAEKLLEQGLIKPGPVEVLSGGLHAVQGGLDRLKADQVSGKKLVVHPHDRV
ncbi:GroES-like protein [Fomes fomentarius]|nr:GroES-like protein [Fomes fomentarius]